MKAELPSNETQRLAALNEYDILDTDPEESFDDITYLASQICGTPIGLISFIDKDRQWFKSKVGTTVSQTSRDIAFCAHGILQKDGFVVEDALMDGRFSENPMVTGNGRIRFYAGSPLITSDGFALGMLCVNDHVPRKLEESQLKALSALSRQVVAQLELRFLLKTSIRGEEQLRASELSYRRLFEAAQDGILILEIESGRITDVNPYLTKLLGFTFEEVIGKTVAELSPFKDIGPNTEMLEQLQRVGYVRHDDLPLETKDGRSIAVEFVCNVYKAGDKNVIQCNIRNITERKKSGDRLKLLEECISNLNETVLVTEADAEMKIIFVNRAFERLTGYTVAEALGRGPRFLQGERTDKAVLAEIHEALTHQRAIQRQIINYRKDGGEYLIDIAIAPVLNAKGKCTHFVAVERDITVQERTKMALTQLATIVESSDASIVSIDLNGIVTSWNGGAQGIYGYTAAEMVGTSVMRLVPPERMKEESPIMGKISRGESTLHRDTVRVTKAGKLIDISVTTSPITDANGKPIGASFVARETTKQKIAEEQIAEQAALLDKAQDGIVVRDLAGVVLFWSKGAERMYGWTREEAKGRTIASLLYNDPEKFEEINRIALKQGEWFGEIQHFSKDKRELSIQARSTIVLDKAGEPKSVLMIYTDITEKKKIEVQFMRAQRMESIGTLAGGVAHDLNNILAPIMMSIDILKTMATEPKAKKILETIEASTRRGASIVRQVLSFSRGLEGERIRVEPRDLVKDLESIIRGTFPKDILQEYSVAPDSWSILGDPTQVHQILLNLCVNARDAMPEGGSLTVDIENCVLDEHYCSMNLGSKSGRYVKLSVTDSGTGMHPKVVERIFDPFFTTKEPNKGTGLGLSTVMAIVKSHEGSINVYSEPGKGTTFNAYLPAMEPSAKARKEQLAQRSLPRGNGETVLLVDDEASILAITVQTLQAFGYKVLTASDGADAVGVYAQHKDVIGVVLTDMMMPVMNGAAAIHALMRLNPAVKIIAASGLFENEQRAKASGAGVEHFLDKPYTAGTLLKALRLILDAKPAPRRKERLLLN